MAKCFNQDIGKWVIYNVEKMKSMFYEAESFNQDSSKWKKDNPNFFLYIFDE